MPDFSSASCRRCLQAWMFLIYSFLVISATQPAYSQDILSLLKTERNGLCKSLFAEDCKSPGKMTQRANSLQGTRMDDAALRRYNRVKQRTARRFIERLEANRSRITVAKGPNSFIVANEQDSLALVALYEGLDGPSWFDQAGWLTENVSNWDGVSMSEGGRVIALSLPGNNLFGELPADISMLSELIELNLGDNFVIGELPDEMGLLQNLSVLNLSFNFISGIIPDSFQNLSNLTDLTLWGNNLEGQIPVGLTNIAGLEVLSLEFNQLTGLIPPELGLLTELKELYIDNNLLAGEIPAELGNLSNLVSTFLGNNNLQGSVPIELTTIEGLRVLSIENAGLSGDIPSEIADLSQLVTLDLSSNFFEGAFPESLLDLFFLGNLYLNNNQFSGALPTELGTRLMNLVELDLAENFFEGQLPASIGQLQLLNYMDLSFNLFSGSLPDMNPNQRMRFLYLNNNAFEGTIDTQFFQIFSLFELDLSWNNITGELPESLANNVFMQDLRLAQNNFSGLIPGNYTSMSDLIILDFWENNLTGPLPEGFAALDILFILDVGGNALSGEVPADLGDNPAVGGLFIDNNAFEGALPQSFATNDSLIVLLINDNELTFVPDMTDHPFLDSLSISNNYLTFDSIEQNAKAAGGNVTYAPQRPIRATVDELDMSIRFSTEVGGTANSYQWFLGESSLGDATQPVYEAPFASLIAEDSLVLEVTNFIVTDLVLESEPVRADARLTRVDITPADIMLFPGDSLQLSYTGFDQFDNERRFNGSWSATGGSISETGLFIAGTALGTFEVMITGLNGVTVGTAPVLIEDPSVVSVEDPMERPYLNRLYTNYPNPFSSSTELHLELASATAVSLKIFDVLGREVLTVIDGALQGGTHRFSVDASDWPAGMYLYRVETGDFVETRTMVKVR